MIVPIQLCTELLMLSSSTYISEVSFNDVCRQNKNYFYWIKGENNIMVDALCFG